MVEASVFRNPTEREKEDYRIIGTITIFDKFRKVLIEKEQEMTKAHKPFCYRCAKIDFEDKVNNKIKELTRKNNKITEEDLSINDIKNFSLDNYANINRFKLIGESEAIEQVRVGITNKPQLIGHHQNFICKERGCGISVFVPLK